MVKIHVAVLKTPSGKLKTLAVSEDADEVLSAYKGCTEAGEVAMTTHVRPERRKTNGRVTTSRAPKAAPKAKASAK